MATELNSIEEIEWEEHIQEVTGWTRKEVWEQIDEVCIDHGYHPDDSRQEATEVLVGKVIDNARRWMLPKYIKKFEKEIKELEEFKDEWKKVH